MGIVWKLVTGGWWPLNAAGNEASVTEQYWQFYRPGAEGREHWQVFRDGNSNFPSK